jgi:tetratricopeptide (TPR) repeat protein
MGSGKVAGCNERAAAAEGQALLERGEYDAALVAFNKVLAEGADAEVHFGRGVALRWLKRWEEAAAAYEEALRLRPDYAAAYFNRAFALEKLGRLEEAVAAYDRALALEPDNAKAHNNRGVALAGLGRLDEALRAYDAAVALDAGEARLYYNRACAYALAGAREPMLADLGRALKLEPRLAKAARADADFEAFVRDADFRRLVYPEENRSEGNKK